MQNPFSLTRRFAYPKSRRLLKPPEFQRVFDNVDCKQGGRFCTLLSTKSNQDESRLGLIAAKKNLKLAVQRNRVKRLLRETFRLKHEEFIQLNCSFDVIALVKASAANAPAKDIHSELEKQWSKLIAKRQELN